MERDAALAREADAEARYRAECAARAAVEEALDSRKNLAKFLPFSAVSAPISASQNAFCSIFQNLPDSVAESFGIKFANFAR